ncbi:MAG TPA: SRPBCC family protein [Gaiellales bacterium]|nr:SRPBCC family protein [Gaiellales bacterium]
MKVTVSATCPAPPEVVWEWIADPHKHIRMLPDEIRNAQVLENGDMACELVTVGVREPMTVRVVQADPPRRLVEERVDGRRKGTSVFEIEPEGEHASRVTLTAEVELSRLASAVASGPMKSALGDQLRNLATLVATEA